MADLDARDKARLIKEALKIVDELAECDFSDTMDIEELIDRAEKLKRYRNWRLT